MPLICRVGKAQRAHHLRAIFSMMHGLGHVALLLCPPSRGLNARSRSRDMNCNRGLLENFSRPPNQRAQGRPGACCTRGPACDLRKQNGTRAYRAAGTLSGLPCAMALRLTSCSPRRTALLPPLSLRSFASPGRNASTATSEPHDFAVRIRRVRLLAPSRVHRISPRVRDDGQRPSSAVRRAELCR